MQCIVYWGAPTSSLGGRGPTT